MEMVLLPVAMLERLNEIGVDENRVRGFVWKIFHLFFLLTLEKVVPE